jgi:hypothetical protein
VVSKVLAESVPVPSLLVLIATWSGRWGSGCGQSSGVCGGGGGGGGAGDYRA